MSPEYILLTDKGMPWYKEHQNRHVSKMQLQNIVYVLLPVLFLMILHNTVCPSVPFTIKEEGENSRERLPVLLGMDHFFNNPQSTMLLTSDAVRMSECPASQGGLLSCFNVNLSLHGIYSPCSWGGRDISREYSMKVTPTGML